MRRPLESFEGDGWARHIPNQSLKLITLLGFNQNTAMQGEPFHRRRSMTRNLSFDRMNTKLADVLPGSISESDFVLNRGGDTRGKKRALLGQRIGPFSRLFLIFLEIALSLKMPSDATGEHFDQITNLFICGSGKRVKAWLLFLRVL